MDIAGDGFQAVALQLMMTVDSSHAPRLARLRKDTSTIQRAFIYFCVSLMTVSDCILSTRAKMLMIKNTKICGDCKTSCGKIFDDIVICNLPA